MEGLPPFHRWQVEHYRESPRCFEPGIRLSCTWLQAAKYCNNHAELHFSLPLSFKIFAILIHKRNILNLFHIYHISVAFLLIKTFHAYSHYSFSFVIPAINKSFIFACEVFHILALENPSLHIHPVKWSF